MFQLKLLVNKNDGNWQKSKGFSVRLGLTQGKATLGRLLDVACRTVYGENPGVENSAQGAEEGHFKPVEGHHPMLYILDPAEPALFLHKRGFFIPTAVRLAGESSNVSVQDLVHSGDLAHRAHCILARRGDDDLVLPETIDLVPSLAENNRSVSVTPLSTPHSSPGAPTRSNASNPYQQANAPGHPGQWGFRHPAHHPYPAGGPGLSRSASPDKPPARRRQSFVPQTRPGAVPSPAQVLRPVNGHHPRDPSPPLPARPAARRGGSGPPAPDPVERTESPQRPEPTESPPSSRNRPKRSPKKQQAKAKELKEPTVVPLPVAVPMAMPPSRTRPAQAREPPKPPPPTPPKKKEVAKPPAAKPATLPKRPASRKKKEGAAKRKRESAKKKGPKEAKPTSRKKKKQVAKKSKGPTENDRPKPASPRKKKEDTKKNTGHRKEPLAMTSQVLLHKPPPREMENARLKPASPRKKKQQEAETKAPSQIVLDNKEEERPKPPSRKKKEDPKKSTAHPVEPKLPPTATTATSSDPTSSEDLPDVSEPSDGGSDSSSSDADDGLSSPPSPEDLQIPSPPRPPAKLDAPPTAPSAAMRSLKPLGAARVDEPPAFRPPPLLPVKPSASVELKETGPATGFKLNHSKPYPSIGGVTGAPVFAGVARSDEEEDDDPNNALGDPARVLFPETHLTGPTQQQKAKISAGPSPLGSASEGEGVSGVFSALGKNGASTSKNGGPKPKVPVGVKDAGSASESTDSAPEPATGKKATAKKAKAAGKKASKKGGAKKRKPARKRKRPTASDGAADSRGKKRKKNTRKSAAGGAKKRKRATTAETDDPVEPPPAPFHLASKKAEEPTKKASPTAVDSPPKARKRKKQSPATLPKVAKRAVQPASLAGPSTHFVSVDLTSPPSDPRQEFRPDGPPPPLSDPDSASHEAGKTPDPSPVADDDGKSLCPDDPEQAVPPPPGALPSAPPPPADPPVHADPVGTDLVDPVGGAADLDAGGLGDGPGTDLNSLLDPRPAAAKKPPASVVEADGPTKLKPAKKAKRSGGKSKKPKKAKSGKKKKTGKRKRGEKTDADKSAKRLKKASGSPSPPSLRNETPVPAAALAAPTTLAKPPPVAEPKPTVAEPKPAVPPLEEMEEDILGDAAAEDILHMEINTDPAGQNAQLLASLVQTSGMKHKLGIKKKKKKKKKDKAKKKKAKKKSTAYPAETTAS